MGIHSINRLAALVFALFLMGQVLSVMAQPSQYVVIMLEEDAFFNGERVQYLNGRQKGVLLHS